MNAFSVWLLMVGAVSSRVQTSTPDAHDRIHSPLEIMQVASDSDITYEIGIYVGGDVPKAAPPVLSEVMFVGTRPDGSRAVMTYGPMYAANDAASEHIRRAEASFQEKKWHAAREAYAQALAEVPESSALMTFIGQTHGIEGDVAAARDWYGKALAQNPHDYLAWFLLADFDRVAGDLKTSVERITTAHLLNRNNPRVLAALERIYEDVGDAYEPWTLAPLYSVSQDDTGAVNIAAPEHATSDWLIYAMCKALWRYEPGYREERMGGREEPLRVVEERACLGATVVAAMNVAEGSPSAELSDDMKRIHRAAESGHMTGLILYEIIAVEQPHIVYILEEEAMRMLREYVAAFH